MSIPVVDLFAGCGGLGEGFNSLGSSRGSFFDIAISVEKDVAACSTLTLRKFFREFASPPDDYYSYLRGEILLETLIERFPDEWSSADARVLNCELGGESKGSLELYRRIDRLTSEKKNWVLIGGPPCQAYSSSGRSRNKGNAEYAPENDCRHFLYRHFLDIIAKFQPPVFLMENVTGLLTAKVSGEGMFSRICQDLENPGRAIGCKSSDENYNLGYQLFPLANPASFDLFHRMENKPSSYIVDSSEYGLAQSRNRVFLLGVRTDLKHPPKLLQKCSKRFNVLEFIGDLPKLRSGLSKQDSCESWLRCLHGITESNWFSELESGSQKYISTLLQNIRLPKNLRGGRFVKCRQVPKALREWFYDPKLRGCCNHEARSHMPSDLHRYLFMASETMRREDLHRKIEAEFLNVTLADFPDGLLPLHRNVNSGVDKGKLAFPDRFKVQRRFNTSSTIVSHLKSDGHYFIHYDPEQCRSLTVREVARLQSFPDNFFFEGSRSDAYQQIGNAVPPYLSQQIAFVINDLLARNNFT